MHVHAYGASMPDIQEQLIDAIKSSGQSRYEISKGTGVAQSQLTRLFSRENNMSTVNIELVAEYLGLELVLRKKRAGGSKQLGKA